MREKQIIRTNAVAHIALALLTLLLLMITGVTVRAAFVPIQITLPVEQYFITENGDDFQSTASVNYVVKALDADAPLPDGTTGGNYTFSLKGNLTSSVTIEFSKPGIFSYQLTAAPTASFDKHYTWKSQVYTIKAYVKNDGSYLLVITNGTNVKVNTISWAYVHIPGQGGSDEIASKPNVISAAAAVSSTANTQTETESEESMEQDLLATAPQTSDDYHLEFWLAVSVLSCIGLLVCVHSILRLRGQGG